MERLVSPLFWGSLATSALVAFLVPPGPLRWTAIVWLGVVGVLFASVNWALVVGGVLGRRGGSLVPVLGAVLMCAALAAVPVDPLRWWAPATMALDPSVPLTIFSLCCRERCRERISS